MSKIRTIIIDDEFLARKRIRRLIEKDNELSIVAECTNGLEAVQLLQEQAADLLFLDVQMPEFNGFEVLEQLELDRLPAIIFVTAYDKYALKAFEVHAVDYLLKPFHDERFYEALQHAKDQIGNLQTGSLKDKLLNLLADITGKKTRETDSDNTEKVLDHPNESVYLERLLIKSAGRIFFVKTSEIIRIKAAGKYLEIMLADQELTTRQTMNEIESKLDPNHFLRIHRSTIINLDQIKEMQHWYKGDYIFILQNGEKFTSSSSYRKNLERIMNLFS